MSHGHNRHAITCTVISIAVRRAMNDVGVVAWTDGLRPGFASRLKAQGCSSYEGNKVPQDPVDLEDELVCLCL